MKRYVNGDLVDVPPDEIAQIAAAEVALDAVRLEAARAKKLTQIERERDAQAFTNVTAHGRTWQADARSRGLLGDAITLAQAGLPLPPVWRDAGNQDMPITSLADLLAIAGAMAVQTQAAYAESWARKAALGIAVDLAGIDAA